MRRLKIVGGGLTGTLAALQANALGCRDIELHERFDSLGGVCRTRTAQGVELRTGTTYFGPPGDPIRDLLSAHGCEFDTIDNRFGSVTLDGAGAPVLTDNFGGPAYDLADIALAGDGGGSLADRIAAYPEAVQVSLQRYCAWHLGEQDLSRIHADAATPLAINRIFPRGADLNALAGLKSRRPDYDELYAIPRGLSGRVENLQAGLPRGGFGALFTQAGRALDAIGVKVDTEWLVSPRSLNDLDPSREAVVWAANPLPLFKLAGLPGPELVKKTFISRVFKARWDGPLPFYVQNFTTQGAIFRLYVYESRGQTLAVAECVADADAEELRRDMAWLTEGFGAPLEAGDLLHTAYELRWIYNSIDAVEKLSGLRTWAAARWGDAFIPGAWEAYGKGQKFAEVSAALSRALTAEAMPLSKIA
jgi:hypothetical protein